MHRARRLKKNYEIYAVIILQASLQNFHWENFRESKAIRKIRENFPPRKYPAIRYNSLYIKAATLQASLM